MQESKMNKNNGDLGKSILPHCDYYCPKTAFPKFEQQQNT